jgi:hypothetical protein
LGEIVVSLSNSEEWRWCCCAYHLVNDSSECATRRLRGRRYGDEDPGRVKLPKGVDCGMHARAGREPVIDENHDFVADVRRGSPFPVGALPSSQLTSFLLGNALYNLRAYPQAPDHIVIDDDHAAARDRPHRQLAIARDAKLAYQEHVEWGPQRTRYFECHRNSASRKSEDDHIATVPVALEEAGKHTTCLSPIPEETVRHLDTTLRRFFGADRLGALLLQVR